MTARDVIARALADIRCNRGKFDGCPRQWCQCRGWSDLTLAALAGAGFAVVPDEVVHQLDRLPERAPANQIDALAWIAAAMEAKRAMVTAAPQAHEGDIL